MNSSSTGFNTVSATALFNISLQLQLIFPSEKSFDIKDNVTWNQIKELAYFNISREWLENVDVWYMPLMSYSAAEHWRQYFTGDKTPFNQTASKDWKNFCGYEIWEDPIAILKGFNETQVVKCYLEENVIGAWNTTYWSDKNSQATLGSAVLSLTDNAKYLVEIRIWKNQMKDWVVFSTEKVISKEMMDQIVKHISQLGFNPQEAFTVDYENCPEVDLDTNDVK